MNTCVIEIDGKEYTLCLTRIAVKGMEMSGFNLREFAEKPITYIEKIWVGGFLANHSDMNHEEVVNLMDKYKEEGGDVMEVINFLMEEYSNFVYAPTDTKSKTKKHANITRV